MAEVPLVDLEVIVRYSLAIRQELAPAEEVLAALDESRALVLALLERGTGNGSGDDADLPQEQPADQGKPSGGEGEDRALEVDLDREVADAEDEVALDDLADSGSDVDGTPGLDPEPAPVLRVPLSAGGAARGDANFAAEDQDAEEENQAWVDEVERIRLRRIRKARQEAEERQARQAELAAEARRAKQAEEARQAELAEEAARAKRAAGARRAEAARRAEEEAREEQEARRVQQARRAERGLRAGKPRAGDAARSPRGPRGPRARPAEDIDDVLELPPPLSADEAARRREERRRRRSQG